MTDTQKFTLEIDGITKKKIEFSAQALGLDEAQVTAEAIAVFFRKLVTDGKIPMDASYSLLNDESSETNYPIEDPDALNERYNLTPKELASLGKAQAKNAEKARQGDPKAQNVMGTYYESGNGIAKNENKAIYWYTKAAEQGNSNAQYHLGVLYNKVKDNPLIAYMWFEVAKLCDFNLTPIHNDYIMRLTERLSLRQLQLAQAEAQKKFNLITQKG